MHLRVEEEKIGHRQQSQVQNRTERKKRAEYAIPDVVIGEVVYMVV